MESHPFSELTLPILCRCIGCHTDPRFAGLVLRTSLCRQGVQSHWCLRVQIKGHRYYRLIGAYPTISVEEAWERAQLCRRLLQDCFDIRDPLGEAIQSANLTFKDYWIRWVSHEREIKALQSKKYLNDILARGVNHLFPFLGDLNMEQISALDVANAINQAYQTCAVSTVRKIHNNLMNFYQWMQAMQLLNKNSFSVTSSSLRVLVTKPSLQRRPRPHPAIAQTDLPRFVQLTIRPEILYTSGVLPLLFTLLTASRIGNVIGSLDCEGSSPMEWQHINSQFTIWTVPADYMKSGRTNGNHVVPLSLQAQKIIRLSQQLQAANHIQSRYVFPNPDGSRFDYRKLLNLVDKLCALDQREGHNGFIDEDLKKPFHIHGLRSTFKTWGTDHGMDWTLTEIALHHRIDKLKYDRSKALDRRRKMMQKWADFCFSNVKNRWLD